VTLEFTPNEEPAQLLRLVTVVEAVLVIAQGRQRLSFSARCHRFLDRSGAGERLFIAAGGSERMWRSLPQIPQY
jgi:hypothetical protein